MVLCLIKQSRNKWKTKLYADGKLLVSVPITEGIFQGHLFSALLFVVALLSVTDVLGEAGMRYQLEKTNHLITRK